MITAGAKSLRRCKAWDSQAEVRGWEQARRGAAECQGRNMQIGTGKLEKSHGIAFAFSTNYWQVGLVVISMEEGY